MDEENKTNEEVEKNENVNENTNEEVKQEENEVKQENVSSNEEEMNELNDRYKRLFAEFENYKKRTQKESLTKRAEITADVVSSILPVVDNLEKAVEVKMENTAYQDGIKLILKQLYDVLNKFGMEEIPTIGQQFDPELHEAVQHIDDPEKGSNEIVQEYRKGYRIGTKVVRHAMVVVAN
ncbi:MAG: nucleotide exchange factor GrpE [Clostridia bacterium]|nr:nucleotide exchange factor GrpE [Clostridia bacterium]